MESFDNLMKKLRADFIGLCAMCGDSKGSDLSKAYFNAACDTIVKTKSGNFNDFMGFGEALNYVMNGEKITRDGWTNKNMFVGLKYPDENSDMDLHYLYMCTVSGDTVPWVASQTDMLADDWQVID